MDSKAQQQTLCTDAQTLSAPNTSRKAAVSPEQPAAAIKSMKAQDGSRESPATATPAAAMTTAVVEPVADNDEETRVLYGGPLSYQQFRKLFPATRNFQTYDHNARANHASSHRVGYLKRQALGEHYYTHLLISDRCYPTAGRATEAAYEIYMTQFATEVHS